MTSLPKDTSIDPILEYLLDFNKIHSIEYTDRYLIPKGGLAKMLENFQGYHLNIVEVTKSELSEVEQSTKDDISKFLEMI